MMDKSTENPGNDPVSTKGNGSIKSDEKTSTDGGINVSMMEKFRRSFRLPTRKNPPSPGDKESKLSPESDEPAKMLDSAASPQPPSPSLSPGSASTSPKNNQKKEDDDSDVSHKSRPLTPSNTDPSMPRLEGRKRILERPEVASNINTEALGNLLPDELLKPLEEKYLSKQQSDLIMFIDRVLDEAKKEWDQGKEPTRDDGCYASAVAYDVIQVEDFLVDRDLFPEDVRENCLQVLTEMKQSAHTYLLTPVHKVLKPHYKKLGTSDWLKKNTFEKLLNSTEEELQQLQGSSQSSYQELIGQLHQEVTEEYVRRLLKGEVKLKDSNQQQKAYETVKENAEKLHELFAEM
ncbi:unnamed protein product [Oreochromis niloticus]|nr:unnamed protein product [Mustela putorius furo]